MHALSGHIVVLLIVVGCGAGVVHSATCGTVPFRGVAQKLEGPRIVSGAGVTLLGYIRAHGLHMYVYRMQHLARWVSLLPCADWLLLVSSKADAFWG